MPRVRGYEPFFSLHIKSHDTSYHVTLWEQPLHWWLAARIYHAYDMRIFKVPGFQRLEKWLWRRHERRHPDDDLYIPLGCRQDLRCYELSVKRKTTLATLDVGSERYDRICRRS